MSNARMISAIPAGKGDVLFKHVIVSIIKVGLDHVPDLNPHPLDQALVLLNRQMLGVRQMRLDWLRSSLDQWSPRRMLPGVKFREGALLSDLVLAAVMVWPDTPYGLLYEWPAGDVMWPEGRKFVWWRQELWDLHDDGRMVRWTDPEDDD